MTVQNRGVAEIADPEMMPARENYSDEDVKYIAGCPELPKMYHITEFIRKLLTRGRPCDIEGFEILTVNDGQKVYPAKVVKERGTIKKETIREILSELPYSIGAWKEGSREEFYIRTAGLTSDDPEYADWEVCILALERSYAGVDAIVTELTVSDIHGGTVMGRGRNGHHTTRKCICVGMCNGGMESCRKGICAAVFGPSLKVIGISYLVIHVYTSMTDSTEWCR